MSSDALSKQFKALCDEWGAAIANHDHDWFERHFTDDFLGTAQPWPTLNVDKQKMIELDKAIETMEVEWLHVTARKFGDVVLTSGVVRYIKEVFKKGTTIGEGMPTGDELSSLVNGRMALYINGWRHNGTHWQIFDHHMVSVIDRLDE
ncbi:hypothetical protein [Roseiterribacter gracilis]|uniref:Uncharacterized protein n=1 Tax=Roseiterribacter gracilis TaxID=2812848 RepID=A0A8S8XD70_9PROT|nr:hypothetical protein TMPK1_18860 [Rhodospirillales bacterium TMPK1]